MSWTVQQEDSAARGPTTIPDANLEEILQKVVEDDDDDETFQQSTGGAPAPTPSSSGNNNSSNQQSQGAAAGGTAQQSGLFTAHQSLYTKSSQVFSSPPPLTPSDLQATPVKDPLESFNSWVRTQTPTSSRNSPTPNGSGFYPTSGVQSPPSAQRQPLQPAAMPFLGGGTPQKQGALTDFFAAGSPATLLAGAGGGAAGRQPPLASYNPPRHPPQLESIIEHRKQLILQMEELALQEMELRSGGGGIAVPAALSNPQAGHTFPEWSPSNASPYAAGTPHTSSGTPSAMVSAFSNGITAENIRGRVYETAKDQHGCRFLQRWLDSNYDGEAVQVIMSEIIPHVAELMTDQYANFLVQKLFDIMPHDIRYNVAQVAAPHIAHIALTPHGTFSVQKLIETIATREEMEIVREALSHDVVRLVKDVHGNHVIQKVLQRFEHPDKEFIYEAVASDCAAIATNKQGCCVLQRCLEFASPAQHKALVACILGCCLQIVQDPFGNYVLQYVLEANDSSINDTIARAFMPHLVQLCMNKFSSNVMEKVLRGATQPVRDAYVETMRNPDVIASLMQDDFGNYVLQTALTISSPGQSEALVAVIRPLMPMIKNAPYAKKLEAKMDLIMKKKSLHSPHRGGGGGGGAGFVPRGGAGTVPMEPYEVTAPHHHHHHHHHHRGYGGPRPPFRGGWHPQM